MAAPHGSVRSPIALVFLSLSTLMITLSSLVMCSAVLYVLFQLKQATSPGNGAKYRCSGSHGFPNISDISGPKSVQSVPKMS